MANRRWWARRTEDLRATIAGTDPTALFWAIGGVCLALALTMIAYSSAREPSSADYRLVDAIQDVHFPGVRWVMETARNGTDLVNLALTWAVLLALLALKCRWQSALVTALLPLGSAMCLAIDDLLGSQNQPSAAQLDRQIGPFEAVSLPSATVVAAVLLFGLLFFLARQSESTTGRVGAQAGALALVGLTGFARVWLGTHWVTDVLAGYTLGGFLLVLLLAAYRKVEVIFGDIPFVRAASIPHDENLPHAHALTSTILFRGTTVAKIYNPGFVPRAIYWLAFQAPFAYEQNANALRAAMLRRNLAGMLTEHWYSDNLVSRAVGIEKVCGRYALIGEFIDGIEPRDRHAARAFLRDLADRFDAVGLPTWQIDPRQPRSLGNIIERPDGSYAIIDLESGIVSPLASPRAWMRAMRRGLVPLYDDVYFDLTRAYIEHEAPVMRAAHGDAWLAELRALLAEAEIAMAAWHAGEPRIWSRFVLWILSGFGLRPALARLPAQ